MFMKRTSVKDNLQVWDALGAYTGKSSPPLYQKLDNGRASTDDEKTKLFLQRYSTVSNRSKNNEEFWDPDFTREFNEYLSRYSKDFQSTDASHP